MAPKNLSLEPSKTEACFLEGRKKRKRISVRVTRLPHQTLPNKQVPWHRYGWIQNLPLGITCTYKACEKAKRVQALPIPLLPNIKGPSSKKRKLILTAAYSPLFYGAPIWAEVIKIKKYCDIITKTYRPLKRSICAAYLTVPNNILDIFSGIPPADLYADSRCRQHGGEPKPQIREDIFESWTVRLESDMGADVWFKTLIPHLRSFLARDPMGA